MYAAFNLVWLQVDSLGRGCWLLRRQSYEIMKALREFSPGTTENTRFLLCILKKTKYWIISLHYQDRMIRIAKVAKLCDGCLFNCWLVRWWRWVWQVSLSQSGDPLGSQEWLGCHSHTEWWGKNLVHRSSMLTNTKCENLLCDCTYT